MKTKVSLGVKSGICKRLKYFGSNLFIIFLFNFSFTHLLPLVHGLHFDKHTDGTHDQPTENIQIYMDFFLLLFHRFQYARANECAFHFVSSAGECVRVSLCVYVGIGVFIQLDIFQQQKETTTKNAV